MPAEQAKRADSASAVAGFAELAHLAAIAGESMARGLENPFAALQAEQLLIILDNVPQGICLFDRDYRLIFSNGRFAEIYRLKSAEFPRGRRCARLSSAASPPGPALLRPTITWLAFFRNCRQAAPQALTSVLEDGRRIEVFCQPLPEGGWVATHYDITKVQSEGEVAKDRLTLQTLIDWVPDYLWVKDAESRYVVANMAVAIGHGHNASRDMIGLTDFDLHSPHKARGFREAEIEIMRSGKPQIDQEEAIVDLAGATKWVSTTKVPLRNKEGGVFGLVGVSRDVTARQLANALRDGHAQTLEMIARGAPLAAVFDRLVRLIESQLNDVICSILLVDEDGRHLRVARRRASPTPIAEPSTASRSGPRQVLAERRRYRREPVIVADIAADPLWRDYRDLRRRPFASLLLVDADPVEPWRGARRVRNVLSDRARADGNGDGA